MNNQWVPSAADASTRMVEWGRPIEIFSTVFMGVILEKPAMGEWTPAGARDPLRIDATPALSP
ncbi:hypothetical protein [Xanthomonas arboricola]|uniref:hypothetical protein n=1 Tax=Xanthomonas arboricola TaxID=56448 RepID=UPI0013962D74|nr:hypothetical protein [Xanthomonas arboricola]MDN0279905.1 hypothetical protein [Xanthomonas arboricola pv. juglandis]UQQ00525.1 hypothetical protein KP728_22290 [Xanthomonas arboricola pv. juglandis]UQQ04771.1 hypothetical protein KP727_12565 [Xanthomonas arboricola pv. juglandis]CAD7347026.1 hypothetical protein X12_002231 [Xanthomonas arboricola]